MDKKKILIFLLVFVIIFGVFLRLYKITNDFYVYYDEGLYLGYNIDFLNYVHQHPADNFAKVVKYLQVMAHISLADAKFLWFFIANLRSLFVGVDGNYFLKVVSAILGCLTIFITYLFGKKYYNSRIIGLMSAAMLAVLPSHVYYSRLSMQEAASTFFFLLGFYFYVFSKGRNWRTFVSGIMFSCVFFVNYRMIIIPFILALAELFLAFANGTKIDARKYIWNTLCFLGIVFLVGSIDDGANTRITFAWMFHQGSLAKGHASFLNFLSYPYYIFKLESLLLGIFFFGNLYYIREREWRRLFPFFLVVIQMIIFSFPQEKGVRYLCSSLPFIVMASASLASYLYANFNKETLKKTAVVLTILMFIQMSFVSISIANFKDDYKRAVEDITQDDASHGILSTQPTIEKLFVKNRRRVLPAPRNVNNLPAYFLKGYVYIIIGPQAYISYTKDKRRFSEELISYMQFLLKDVRPYKEYEHFNKRLLERFVLEHNEDLATSISFLRANGSRGYGKMRVYRASDLIVAMKKLGTLR